ncbi:MAG: FixH family protein [Pseudomonadota bacterium]
MNGTARPREITGYHVLALVLTFFAIIIAVNVTMAVIATRSWTGLVVKNSYVASQEYNEKIEAARIQEALGLSSDFSYSDGRFSFELLDHSGKAMPVDEIIITIGRPAHEHKDRRLVLEHGSGTLHELTEDLEAGMWAMEISARSGDLTYRRAVRILIGANGEGQLQ